MRGIILAGGTGTRLHPITLGVSKQLVPVYDKPMIYYPLSTLMLAGIRDILVITTPHEADAVRAAARRRVAVRHQPHLRPAAGAGRARPGVHDRRRLHRRRAESRWCSATTSSTAPGFGRQLRALRATSTARAVFAYWVADPSAYGVVEFDADGKALSLEEKPEQPRSNYAVPGLYFYDNDVVDIAARPQAVGARRATRSPTSTGPTSSRAGCRCEVLERGTAWLDTGTFDVAQRRQQLHPRPSSTGRASRSAAPRRSPGGRASSPTTSCGERAEALAKSGYGDYLLQLLEMG